MFKLLVTSNLHLHERHMEALRLKNSCAILSGIEIADFLCSPERWPDLSWNLSIFTGILNLKLEYCKIKNNQFRLQDDFISSFRSLLILFRKKKIFSALSLPGSIKT